ncbi:MAG: hypothetical protein M3220_18335 [Chloroflexota bacterium]|nr:hypothetical protein [Chloroflexota bacterium]
MKNEFPDGLIEIHDPEIDPARIMEQIRERIQQRREEKGYDRRRFPTFGLTEYPEAPDNQPYDPDLYYYLRLANERYAAAETNVLLAPSPATQMPVVGRVWKMIRREVHNLVLFYVNRAVTHQVNVNRYLISVLNRLTALTQEQQRQIEELQAELQALRADQEEHAD